MNEEIKPLYIPESSGNALPDLSKHGTHNEPPVPINRPRSEPSRAMSATPMKHLLPAGHELRDIIRRRLDMKPLSAPALWASLNQSYQTRPRQEQSVIDAVAGMLTDGELEQRDGKLHVAEPEVVVAETPPGGPVEIPAEMWTMTHTERVLSVLTDEPRTRAWLAERTGLQPRQVSKAAYLLIKEGKAEVVGDVPRTWRRTATNTEVKKMDADDVCKAVLAQMGNTHFEARTVVADISRIADWPHDEATALFDDMIASGYLVRREDGRIMSKDAEPEPTMLTEAQTRDVLLERVSGVCDTAVVIANVMRLSGWSGADVRRLIDRLVTEGALFDVDGTISKPSVRSEDPPAYEIGDDDDGEIPEPGIARPEAPMYVLDSATIDFVRRDSGGHIADECSVTIDADGLSFGGGDVMPFAAIDALMPVLRRVHRAVFGGGDEAE